jgi:hypothetical protein
METSNYLDAPIRKAVQSIGLTVGQIRWDCTTDLGGHSARAGRILFTPYIHKHMHIDEGAINTSPYQQ